MNCLEGSRIDNSTVLVGQFGQNGEIAKDVSRLSELTVRHDAVREREEAADGLKSLLEWRILLKYYLCFESAEFGA